MRLWFVVMLGAVLCSCAAKNFANDVCAIDGGASAGVPLTLTATFGPSGCASSDAVCTVTVDGGSISLDTSATVCSTGTNPGGTVISAPCAVPALEPGTYELLTFNRTLVVVADGGGTTSCSF